MPRRADPDLEERVLKAAQVLWKKGGDQALTMRAVARAAHSNTPAVYRRFKDREDLLRALLRRIASQIGKLLEGENIEQMAEAYIDYALKMPHEYELFYTHAQALSPKNSGAQPIRESRPNFGLLEKLLAQRLGGAPEDHTQLGLAVWSLLHGTTMLLLSKAIAPGHEEALRRACRSALQTLLESGARSID